MSGLDYVEASGIFHELPKRRRCRSRQVYRLTRRYFCRPSWSPWVAYSRFVIRGGRGIFAALMLIFLGPIILYGVFPSDVTLYSLVIKIGDGRSNLGHLPAS